MRVKLSVLLNYSSLLAHVINMLCKPYIIFFLSLFSNVCRGLLVLWILHRISCVNQLILGGNSRSYALSKHVNCTYRFLFKHLWPFFLPPDIKGLNVRRYLSFVSTQTFSKPSCSAYFSMVSVKYKAAKISHECYVTELFT